MRGAWASPTAAGASCHYSVVAVLVADNHALRELGPVHCCCWVPASRRFVLVVEEDGEEEEEDDGGDLLNGIHWDLEACRRRNEFGQYVGTAERGGSTTSKGKGLQNSQ